MSSRPGAREPATSASVCAAGPCCTARNRRTGFPPSDSGRRLTGVTGEQSRYGNAGPALAVRSFGPGPAVSAYSV
jgi:hypothetical protein